MPGRAGIIKIFVCQKSLIFRSPGSHIAFWKVEKKQFGRLQSSKVSRESNLLECAHDLKCVKCSITVLLSAVCRLKGHIFVAQQNHQKLGILQLLVIFFACSIFISRSFQVWGSVANNYDSPCNFSPVVIFHVLLCSFLTSCAFFISQSLKVVC